MFLSVLIDMLLNEANKMHLKRNKVKKDRLKKLTIKGTLSYDE